MYESGLIIAFILSFIVLLIQAIKRRRDENNERSFLTEFLLVIFASIIYSLLSWLTVALVLIMLLGGKVWGISDKSI